VVVTAASVQDRDGAKQLLDILRDKYWRLRHSWADGAYAGPLVDWVRALRPQRAIRLETARCCDTIQWFVVIPKRWIVEVCHSWVNRFRKLLVRFEKKLETHLALLQFACAYLVLKRAEVFR
jgi:transposase